MTDQQKSMIYALREDGLSYSDIAEKMHISRNTIKSFCRTHKILTPVHKKSASADCCLTCGAELVSLPGHKKKQFCDDKCRHQWFNKKNARKPYILTCQNCKREFIAYGNPNKKYCSRDCAKSYRNSGDSHE